MLPLARYKEGKYPPNSHFPRFSSAGPTPAVFKQLQATQSNAALEEMREKKKASLEILKQRAAPYQTVETPQVVQRPASLPQQFDIHSDYHDADEGNPSSSDMTHTESDLPKPTSRVRKLASAAVRGGLSAASSVGNGLASAASSASQGLATAAPAILGAAVSANQAATTVGLSAINHAVDAAVAVAPVARRIARKTGKATGAIGQAALDATQAMATGAGQALADYGPPVASAIGHSAHAVASAAGQALVDYGPPVANAIGQGAHAVASATGQALTQGAQVAALGAVHAALQAPAFATATARTAYFLGKHMGMSFEELLHLVEQAPRAPMLENPKRRRSSSPAGLMLGDAAVPETAAPRTTPAHDTELLHFATEEEWASKPKALLVDQLYKRPGFAEALGIRHSRGNLAKIFRGKTNGQLAQLILKLDAKG